MSNEHVRNAALALVPRDGFNRPSVGQLQEADVHVGLAQVAALDAQAAALGRIADALEALAANTTPAPALQASIGHSH